MPERGQVHRPQGDQRAYDPITGETSDSPDWIPYAEAPVAVLVPESFREFGPERQVLPSLSALDPDYVCEQYAYRTTRCIDTERKSYVLGDDDRYEVVQAQVGGQAFVAVMVFRLVGDEVPGPEGSAFGVVPAFRFRIPVVRGGEPRIAVTGAIGWLVHHRSERATHLDVDWEHPDPRGGYIASPETQVRMDMAVAGSGDTIYAPVMVPQKRLPPTTGIDVLPASALAKKGLFRRNR